MNVDGIVAPSSMSSIPCVPIPPAAPPMLPPLVPSGDKTVLAV